MSGTRIGDAGCTALANAINSGALPALRILAVDNGPLGVDHPKLKAACNRRWRRITLQSPAPLIR